MPRTCSVCGHGQREAIDAALVAGEPYRNIAERFGPSIAALSRHNAAHIPASVAAAKGAAEAAQGGTLLDRLEALTQDARRIGRKAEAAESYPAAIAAIREQARILEILLRVAGELREHGDTYIIAPAWVNLAARVTVALGPYPEARAAVAALLAREAVEE